MEGHARHVLLLAEDGDVGDHVDGGDVSRDDAQALLVLSATGARAAGQGAAGAAEGAASEPNRGVARDKC